MQTQRTSNERLYPPSPQSTNSTQLLSALANSAWLNKSGSARPAQQPTNPNHLNHNKNQGVEGGKTFCRGWRRGRCRPGGLLCVACDHANTSANPIGFGPPEPPSGITPPRPFAARPFGSWSPYQAPDRHACFCDSFPESIGCVPSPQVSSFDSMATELMTPCFRP